MENEEKIFDECIERAIKMARKYMPEEFKNKEGYVGIEEFKLATILFKKELDNDKN